MFKNKFYGCYRLNRRIDMIKEITLDGEKITIDFEGAPFWKLWALQLYCLVMVGKFMKEHKE